MRLLSVYSTPGAYDVLWQLLLEREPHENISHRTMPTWDQHCSFVASWPHHAWYVFESPAGFTAGGIYLSKQREVGIGVLKAHRGQGLATEAIKELMRLHPGKMLANINPGNEQSKRLFTKLGFTHIQDTYARNLC